MSRLFLQLLLCSTFALSGANALAKTFKEALDECAGQNTEYCNKVRIVYNKRKAELAAKKSSLLKQPVANTQKLAPANIAERKQEQLEDKDKPEVNRGEVESPWSLGYFAALDGIGKDDDKGEPAIGMYAHLDLGYTFRSGLQLYVRTPFLTDLSTEEGEDTFTTLDPFFGFKGNIWQGEKWRLWSRLRIGVPVSQASVDDGVTLPWGHETKIIYAGDWASVYLLTFLQGKFYGFGTEGDRNNGSVSFELGIEGIKLTDDFAMYIYYGSGFSRKVGQDLGYLVFTDESQIGRVHVGYEVNSFISIVPGVSYNIDTQETGFSVWLWGSIF